MRTKILLSAGIILCLSSAGYAQEAEETSTNWKDERQEFHQTQKEENKEWWDDYNERRNEAIEGYKEEGLSREEIRENMQSFKDEKKNILIVKNLKIKSSNKRHGKSDEIKDMNKWI